MRSSCWGFVGAIRERGGRTGGGGVRPKTIHSGGRGSDIVISNCFDNKICWEHGLTPKNGRPRDKAL